MLTEKEDNEMKHFKNKKKKLENNLIMFNDESDIINKKIAYSIHELLPRYMQSKRWYLYYSKSKNGSSFEMYIKIIFYQFFIFISFFAIC